MNRSLKVTQQAHGKAKTEAGFSGAGGGAPPINTSRIPSTPTTVVTALGQVLPSPLHRWIHRGSEMGNDLLKVMAYSGTARPANQAICIQSPPLCLQWAGLTPNPFTPPAEQWVGSTEQKHKCIQSRQRISNILKLTLFLGPQHLPRSK